MQAITAFAFPLKPFLTQPLDRTTVQPRRTSIAPLDAVRFLIGPGKAIFSQAKTVLNPDDSPMSVREALVEINAALDEYFSQDEGAFDADTRFALTFFESFGYCERPHGDAEGLAVARNISVDGVVRAGILRAAAGKAQLLRREQLDDSWDPGEDDRLCVWEATQHLIKQLEANGEVSCFSSRTCLAMATSPPTAGPWPTAFTTTARRPSKQRKLAPTTAW